jgi:hypothetical protein
MQVIFGCKTDTWFFQKARIEWMMKLGNEIGGPGRAQAMVKGEGVSLILKSLLIKFKRPVTFPDTVGGLIIPRFSVQGLSRRCWFSSSLRTNPTSPNRFPTRGSIFTAERRCTRIRNERLWRSLIVSWCGTIMRALGSVTPGLRRGMWF